MISLEYDMTSKEKKYVRDKCDNEGFDYNFMYWSSYGDIKDDEFHKLRKEYIEAHRKLAKYIGLKD